MSPYYTDNIMNINFITLFSLVESALADNNAATVSE